LWRWYGGKLLNNKNVFQLKQLNKWNREQEKGLYHHFTYNILRLKRQKWSVHLIPFLSNDDIQNAVCESSYFSTTTLSTFLFIYIILYVGWPRICKQTTWVSWAEYAHYVYIIGKGIDLDGWMQAERCELKKGFKWTWSQLRPNFKFVSHQSLNRQLESWSSSSCTNWKVTWIGKFNVVISSWCCMILWSMAKSFCELTRSSLSLSFPPGHTNPWTEPSQVSKGNDSTAEIMWCGTCPFSPHTKATHALRKWKSAC